MEPMAKALRSFVVALHGKLPRGDALVALRLAVGDRYGLPYRILNRAEAADERPDEWTRPPRPPTDGCQARMTATDGRCANADCRHWRTSTVCGHQDTPRWMRHWRFGV